MRASAKWGKAIGAAAVLLGAASMSGCESGGEVQILDVAPKVGHIERMSYSGVIT